MNRCSECQNREKRMVWFEHHKSTRVSSVTLFSQIPSQMIVRHFETRGGWKFTNYLNTDLAIPRRAHKGSKLGIKTKTKSQERRGRIKKKTTIYLLRLEPLTHALVRYTIKELGGRGSL